MSGVSYSRVLYAAGCVVNLALTAFAIQLGAGNVPIPTSLIWTVPILTAVVTGLMAFLPRVGSEPIAQQVNALAAQGVHKRDMAVVQKEDAPGVEI